jgi:hypothetical protein
MRRHGVIADGWLFPGREGESGGWRDATALQTAYQTADSAGVAAVVDVA